MFKGHWIVADMDGTLTPTPSRAHGKYLSLAQSQRLGMGYGARYRSCLPWLRLFLERGGSLCVVSTAGKRMWTQLYPDLASSLFRLKAAVAGGEGADAKGPDLTAPVVGPSRGADIPEPTPGALYLCGFTGAALFRSRPWETVWRDMDRLHPRWREGAASSSAAAIPVADDNTDIIQAMVPPAGVALEEWPTYRQQGLTTSADRIPSVMGEVGSGGSATTIDEITCAIAREEGRRALVRFFECVSYTCDHNIAAAQKMFCSCLSAKYHEPFTEILRQLLSERSAIASSHLDGSKTGPTPQVCFAQSQVLSYKAVAAYGYFLKETQDALVDVQRLPQANGSVAAGAAVAQVVVMGIPMKYFDHVFPKTATGAVTEIDAAWRCCPQCAVIGAEARSRLEAAGLELKSQPNSVCLHRRGVDKATCVRWLLAQHRQNALSFELSKALAFGDVPESVDAPLTTFPPMQFVSLSPKDAAATRLADRERTVIADGVNTVVFSSSGVTEHYLHHVGGEEEGTAVFLEELLRSCAAEQQEVQPSLSAGADAAVATPTSGWFTPQRVEACAERARRRVEEEEEWRRQNSTAPSPEGRSAFGKRMEG